MDKWNNDNSYLMAASWHQGGKLEETAQLAWTDIIPNNLFFGFQGFIQDFQFGGGEFSVKFSQKFIIWPKFY